MDSLKGFSIGSTDLAKKFKDVRRRTTQKVAEMIGVAEATHQNKQVGRHHRSTKLFFFFLSTENNSFFFVQLGDAYREYVWLGSYLDKFKISVRASA